MLSARASMRRSLYKPSSRAADSGAGDVHWSVVAADRDASGRRVLIYAFLISFCLIFFVTTVALFCTTLYVWNELADTQRRLDHLLQLSTSNRSLAFAPAHTFTSTESDDLCNCTASNLTCPPAPTMSSAAAGLQLVLLSATLTERRKTALTSFSATLSAHNTARRSTPMRLTAKLTSPTTSSTTTSTTTQTTSTTSTTETTTSTTTTPVFPTNTYGTPCHPLNASILDASPLSRKLLANVDTAADPCINFYQFACGQWQLRHPLPVGQPYVSQYGAITKKISTELKEAIENPWNIDDTVALTMVKRYYAICSDDKLAETVKGKSFLDLLHRRSLYLPPIGEWPVIQPNSTSISEFGLEWMLAATKSSFGLDLLFTQKVGVNPLNKAERRLELDLNPLVLGLGSHMTKYYLDLSYAYLMDEYASLIADVATELVNEHHQSSDQASSEEWMVNHTLIREMVTFEQRIAEYVKEASSERNSEAWSVSELSKQIPSFNWRDYFAILLKPKREPSFRVVVHAPLALDRLLRFAGGDDTSKQVLHGFLIWRLLKAALWTLGDSYRQRERKLSSLLWSVDNHHSRKDDCLDVVRGHNNHGQTLGFAAAKMLVQEYPSYRSIAGFAVAFANEFLNDATSALEEDFDWLTENTRLFARNKLLSTRLMVGYPEWIMNKTLMDLYYKDLFVPKDATAFEADFLIGAWMVRSNFQTLGHGSTTLTEVKWLSSSPVASDAWYDRYTNAVIIPLGYLQPQLFVSSEGSRSFNEALLGSVLAHELVHGLTFGSSYYDHYGNWTDWWTSSDRSKFDDALKCLESVYTEICSILSLENCGPNGRSLKEDVADVLGLGITYSAFKKSLFSHQQYSTAYEDSEIFTKDQTFFITSASFWCGNWASGFMRFSMLRELELASHMPAVFRLSMAVTQNSAFRKAFRCDSPKYNPMQKCFP